jgi:hypothetical protein
MRGAAYFDAVVLPPVFDLEQLAGLPGIELDETTAKGSGGRGNEMIDTIDVGKGCPDRVLVGYVELDGRGRRA